MVCFRQYEIHQQLTANDTINQRTPHFKGKHEVLWETFSVVEKYNIKIFDFIHLSKNMK